ncbi:hypothetical protein [Stetteria hydrogenophila]
MRVEAGVEGLTRVYVVTGDGPRDYRILRAAAEKYFYNTLVKRPEPNLFPREARGTGLAGLARRLAALARRTVVDRYLALIDREHLPRDRGQVEELLRSTLRREGFRVEQVEALGEGCWRLTLALDYPEGRRLRVYLAALGWERSIEENLAALIERLHGARVEGSKGAVNAWLKTHGVRDEDLVRRASRRILEESFPTITCALRELAGELGQPPKPRA